MKDKNFISGIYNHCDRWCERCDYAHRCELYYDEKKQMGELEDKDDFMAIVSQNLSDVIDMIQKMAEERGIDLDELDYDETFEIELQKSKNARKHHLAQKALDYANQVEEWLNANSHLEEEKQQYLKNIDLGINLEESDKAIHLLDEALNIINWYQFQIHIKLASAIRYYPHDPTFEDELQNMHHSSAKIALIGIENSMKAWLSLLELLDNEQDFILDTLLKLQQLQTQVHQQFPLLCKYKRPVFED